MKTKLLFLTFLLTGCTVLNQAPIKEVVVNNQTIQVDIASTPSQLQQGLAGREVLNDGEGMLFIFPSTDYYVFWMKGMLIPLDIIWLEDDLIVDISKNVPAPAEGMSDEELPKYASEEEINYVLEVPSGYTDRYGIQIGDRVEYR